MGISNRIRLNSGGGDHEYPEADELQDHVGVTGRDLGFDDPAHAHGPGEHDRADHGQHRRQLVGNELAAALSPPIKEYLLPDDHPAIGTPTVLSEEMARA